MKNLDKLLQHAPPACSCAQCQQQCMLPCTPRVADAQKLIDAGYGDRLMLQLWTADPLVEFLSPALKGVEGGSAPEHPISYGGCTFWNKEGLCDLHALDLKPTEGRLTHHHPKLRGGKKLLAAICTEWDSDAGRALVAAWKAQYHTPPPVRGDSLIIRQFTDWLS